MNKTPKFKEIKVVYFQEKRIGKIIDVDPRTFVGIREETIGRLNFMLVALDNDGKAWIKKTLEKPWELLA
jgi:hypothetical protein